MDDAHHGLVLAFGAAVDDFSGGRSAQVSPLEIMADGAAPMTSVSAERRSRPPVLAELAR